MHRRPSDVDGRQRASGRVSLGGADGRHSDRNLREERDRGTARGGGQSPLNHASPRLRLRDIRESSPDHGRLREDRSGLAAAARMAAASCAVLSSSGARASVDELRARPTVAERQRRHSAQGAVTPQISPVQPLIRQAWRYTPTGAQSARDLGSGAASPSETGATLTRSASEIEESIGKPRLKFEDRARRATMPAKAPASPSERLTASERLAAAVAAHAAEEAPRPISPMLGPVHAATAPHASQAPQAPPPPQMAPGVESQSPARALGFGNGMQRAHSALRARPRQEPQRARSADPRRRRNSIEERLRPGEREVEDSIEPPAPAANRQAPVLGRERSPTDPTPLASQTSPQTAPQSPAQVLSAASACLRRPPPFKTLPSSTFGGRYTLSRYLGRGASATVWEGTHADSHKKIAIKVFDQGNRDKRQAAREMKVLSRIRHPHILEAIEVIEGSLCSHLVCELVDGESLRAYSQRQLNHRLQEHTARRFYTQVVDGVNYCHERLVVHRDLKLENLLLDRTQENVKIIDFGFAAQVASKDAKLRAFCGTPSYMAPEIIRGEGYSGFAADVWALGVVIFALLCGILPFVGRTELQLYAKIRRGTFACPALLGEVPRRLVRSLLKMDASSRPPAAAILKNAWVLGDHQAMATLSGGCSPLGSSLGPLSPIVQLAAAAVAMDRDRHSPGVSSSALSPSRETFGFGAAVAASLGRQQSASSIAPSSMATSAHGSSTSARERTSGCAGPTLAAAFSAASTATSASSGYPGVRHGAKEKPKGPENMDENLIWGAVSPGGRDPLATKAGYPSHCSGGLRRPSLDKEHVTRMLGQRDSCDPSPSSRLAHYGRQIRCAPASAGGS